MTVHFFTKGDPGTPSSRMRAFLVAEELGERGIKAVVHAPAIDEISRTPWPRKFAAIRSIASQLFSVKPGEIIYLQRAMNNKYFVFLCVVHRLLFRRKTVFDLDDAVYDYAPTKAALMMRLSDMIVAGSHEIAAWARRRHTHVELVPTALADTWITEPPRHVADRDAPIVIGWLGNGAAHLESLRLLTPAFEKMLQRNLPVSFTLIDSSEDPRVRKLFAHIKGLKLTLYGRTDDDDARRKLIATFTLGTMPLTDTVFSRGRCALKALEYMACGVPTIASPVGEAVHIIRHGVNGFLAATPDAWADAVEQIYRSPDILLEMGRRARATVMDSYTYRVTIPKLITILEQL